MTDERYTTRRTVLATISGLITGLGVISTDMAAADQHEPVKEGNAEDEDDGANHGDSNIINPEDYSMEHDAHVTSREKAAAEAYVDSLTSPPLGGGGIHREVGIVKEINYQIHNISYPSIIVDGLPRSTTVRRAVLLNASCEGFQQSLSSYARLNE